MGMNFWFKITEPFLKNAGHPITVPKKHHKNMKAELLHQGDFVVILPKGERFTAKMYRGRPDSYNEYYQLQFRGGNREVPGYVEAGDEYFVVLARSNRKNHAILEHWA
jgi:hypothetical protein